MSKKSIKFVKLTTGEEFVADVHTKDGDLVVSNPTVLVVQNGPSGPQIQSVPWCSFCEDREMVIPQESVMFTGSVSDDLEKAFIKQHSGIEVVGGPSKIIT